MTGSEITAELHIRASKWYEENGLEVEAFQHATAAGDLDRAERLIDGNGMPLHFRGATAPVLHWLESLPRAVLDSRPSLWVTLARRPDLRPPQHGGTQNSRLPKILRDRTSNDRTRD
jgi:LuxR family maltose regulon positive regulatory protein